MPPFSNLISDSLLVNDTIKYLRSTGGKAPAARVVERIMKIRIPDALLAIKLMGDLVDRDSRLILKGQNVEILELNHEDLDLSKSSFVVIDLETTGAKAPPCRITEIGAFLVKDGRVQDKFHSLINPEMPIPPFITGLTGINDQMVANSPLFNEVADDLLNFIGDSVIVAHNAGFDLGFLNHEIGRIYEDYKLANASLCTVKLSRRLLPEIENHKLSTIARHFSFDLENHHRATDDAFATSKIFIEFLNRLYDLGLTDYGSVKKFGNKKINKHYVG